MNADSNPWIILFSMDIFVVFNKKSFVLEYLDIPDSLVLRCISKHSVKSYMDAITLCTSYEEYRQNKIIPLYKISNPILMIRYYIRHRKSEIGGYLKTLFLKSAYGDLYTLSEKRRVHSKIYPCRSLCKAIIKKGELCKNCVNPYVSHFCDVHRA